MQAVKYTFDRGFDGGAAEQADRDAAQTARLVDAARQEGEAQGFAAGRAATLADIEAATQAAAERAAELLHALLERRGEMEAIVRQQAAELATAIARKLAAGLLDRDGELAAQRFALEALEQHVAASRLVVRVADAGMDALKSLLDAKAVALGYQGRLIYLGEPTLGMGDCRVEWADGGMERQAADRFARLDAQIDAFVSTLQSAQIASQGETR